MTHEDVNNEESEKLKKNLSDFKIYIENKEKEESADKIKNDVKKEEQDKEKTAKTNIYRLGKQIAKESYEMELLRENRIDSRFEKLTTFVSLIIAILGYFAKSEDIFKKMNQTPVVIFVFILFLLLSSVLILSLIGQFYRKTKYFKDGEDFTDKMEDKWHEYVDENEASLQYIYQYGDVHKALRKRHNFRKTLLQVAQSLLLVAVFILFISGLIYIIK